MLQRGAPKLGKDGKPMKDKHGKIIYEPYRIKILNTINFKKSMHYNPFAYIHSEKDILKLVTTLIANTKGEGKAGDDFWVKAETLLYCALIGYIHYEAPVEEQNLGVWVRNQKQTYANGTLQPEKAERLESIGILWEQSNFDFKWNEAYEAAKLYFEENGSLNVPIGYTTPDGIALGKWVARQQYAYKSPNNSNCKLTPTRVTLLEKIGMQWEKTDPWQHKYNLALDYLQMHGNLQIPAKYKTADGIWLGRWLYDQKVLLRKQSPRLSAEQTNKLRKLLDEGTAGKAC